MTIQTNGVDLSNLSDNDILRSLALRWKDRRETQGLKPKTVKHAEQQLAFFIGAMEAMTLVGRSPPMFGLMLLSVGRDSVDLWGGPKE